MAGRLSLWGAGQILRTFFGRTAEPPPAFYLAFIKDVAPTPYMSGAELNEPDVEAGYSRVEIPNEAVNWDSEEGMLHVTSNLIDFNFVTASADWGRIGYWALCNASVDGYTYFIGEMEEELIVLAGDQPVLAADELVIELGPFFTEEDF